MFFPYFQQRVEEVEDLKRLKAFYLKGEAGERAVTLNVFLEDGVDQVLSREKNDVNRKGDLVKKALSAALNDPHKSFKDILDELFLAEKGNCFSWRGLHYDTNINTPFNLLVNVVREFENNHRPLNTAEQASILEHLGIRTNVRNPLPLSFLREKIQFTEAPSLLNLRGNMFLDSTQQSGDNRQEKMYVIKNQLIGDDLNGSNKNSNFPTRIQIFQQVKSSLTKGLQYSNSCMARF